MPQCKNARGVQLYGPSGAALWSSPTIDPRDQLALCRDRRQLLDAGRADLRRDRRVRSQDRRDQMGEASDRRRRITPWRAARRTRRTVRKNTSRSRLWPVADSGVFAGRQVACSLAGQKSGEVHAFDPDAEGKKLWTRSIGRGSELGGIEWGSASDGTRFFAPLSDMASRIPARSAAAALTRPAGGGLFAMNPADGSFAWTASANGCADKPSCSPALSAPAAAIPGAVSPARRRPFPGLLDRRRQGAVGLRYRPGIQDGQRRFGARRID